MLGRWSGVGAAAAVYHVGVAGPRALRPREACTLRDAVALDQRLWDAAGPSLRYYGTRAHAAREQARAELLAEAAGAPPATHLDDFGAIVIADLARRGEPAP